MKRRAKKASEYFSLLEVRFCRDFVRRHATSCLVSVKKVPPASFLSIPHAPQASLANNSFSCNLMNSSKDKGFLPVTSSTFLTACVYIS